MCICVCTCARLLAAWVHACVSLCVPERVRGVCVCVCVCARAHARTCGRALMSQVSCSVLGIAPCDAVNLLAAKWALPQTAMNSTVNSTR